MPRSIMRGSVRLRWMWRHASRSLRTVLELVLILRDEGDADALVSRLLQNHKPEERHRLLLAEGRAGTCFLWMDSGEFDLGEFWARGGKLQH